jgi:hypothetical protein
MGEPDQAAVREGLADWTAGMVTYKQLDSSGEVTEACSPAS